MYKRKLNQVSVFENPAMFGGIALNPENEWVKLADIIPWWVFEKKYAQQFPSNMRQPVCNRHQALEPQIIKEKHRFSEEMTVAHIAINPYLQYFMGMPSFSEEPPFTAPALVYFRKRLSVEEINKINDDECIYDIILSA